MSWSKFDDSLPDRLWALSDAAYRLHTSALAYSSRLLLDGLIPSSDVERLAPRFKQAVVKELAAAGCWKPVDGGWQVVWGLEDQRTRAQVETDRAANRERQEAFRLGISVAELRARKAATETHEGPSESLDNAVTNAVTNGVTNTLVTGAREDKRRSDPDAEPETSVGSPVRVGQEGGISRSSQALGAAPEADSNGSDDGGRQTDPMKEEPVGPQETAQRRREHGRAERPVTLEERLRAAEGIPAGPR